MNKHTIGSRSGPPALEVGTYWPCVSARVLPACWKTRPVGAPGLHNARFPGRYCRPRALTRRSEEFFNSLLRVEPIELFRRVQLLFTISVCLSCFATFPAAGQGVSTPSGGTTQTNPAQTNSPPASGVGLTNAAQSNFTLTNQAPSNPSGLTVKGSVPYNHISG
jgi:hypothetical protein